MSIDVAIPADRNVIKKEAKRTLKYKDLITEIQRMWNVKAKVISEEHRESTKLRNCKKQPYCALRVVLM
jgi:hypothetical protein